MLCVNVDAIIAVRLLGILWKDYKSGASDERDLETATSDVFLQGSMIGGAAKIDVRLTCGRHTDTRTPLSQCGFVV